MYIAARVLARRQRMHPRQIRPCSLQQGREVRHQWDSYIESANGGKKGKMPMGEGLSAREKGSKYHGGRRGKAPTEEGLSVREKGSRCSEEREAKVGSGASHWQQIPHSPLFNRPWV